MTSTASLLVKSHERHFLWMGEYMIRNISLLAIGLLLVIAGLSFLFCLDGLAFLLLLTSAAIALRLFGGDDEDDSGWRPL